MTIDKKLIEIRCVNCNRLIKRITKKEFIRDYLPDMDVYLGICSELCERELDGKVKDLKDEDKMYG